MNRRRFKGLSLFSNVGIAETYLKEVNVDILIANELLKERAAFYRYLYPDTYMIDGDITDPNIFNKIIKESKDKGIDFIIATPPCQGMSCAGKKDPKDPRNFLIYHAIEAIKQLKPRFALIENVPMQQHTKIRYNGEDIYIPDYVQTELGNDYNFNEDRIINSKDYGVAQSRQRYIYLLSSKSENIIWEFPQKENKIVTLKDAIGNLPSLDPLLREECERWRFPDYEKKRLEGLKVSQWHFPPTHSWKQVEWMQHTPSGKSAFLNEHYYPMTKGRRIKGAPRTYMRMDWDKPATTIMQNSGVISAFSTVHPGRCKIDDVDDIKRYYSDSRTLSIYELMLLTSLPKDWNIPPFANETLIRKVIGEGIPPLLIRKIVNHLIKSLDYEG